MSFYLLFLAAYLIVGLIFALIGLKAEESEGPPEDLGPATWGPILLVIFFWAPIMVLALTQKKTP